MALAPVAATTGSTNTASALSKTTADFDFFLKMLTTQLQNQDPLSPMDSTEYTAQLVQYSQVEQSIKQSGTLEDILSRLDSQSLAQASSFVGRNAEFDHPVSGLSETTPAHWKYQAARDVETLTATVKDATGKVVATRTIAPDGTDGSFEWDGTRDNGSRAADGAYTLSIAGLDANGGTVDVAIGSIGVINEATTGQGGAALGVNGVSIPIDKLVRLTAVT